LAVDLDGGDGDDDDTDDEECGASAVLCTEGATAALCGSCKQGYIYRPTSKICKPCKVILSVFLYACMSVGRVWFGLFSSLLL
jgi:hypothetical protein